MKFRITDILYLLMFIIPWNIYSGQTKITNGVSGTNSSGNIYTNTTNSVEVRQYIFTRSVESDFSGVYQNDSISIFLHFIAVLFVLHALIIRLREFLKDERRGIIGSDFIYAGIFSMMSATMAKRDIQTISNSLYKVEWDFSTAETTINFIQPIIPILLLLAGAYEYRDIRFFVVDSIYNTLRFIMLAIFTIISVFPLIWVFIVSINKQTVIQAGVPLWPLDPERQIDFDSYTRFFDFRGNFVYAWVLFMIGSIFLGLLYHQITRAGSWQDMIQGILYSRNPEAAGNNRVSIIFFAVMFIQFLLSMASFTSIIASKPVFGIIPSAHFEWWLKLSDTAGGQEYPIGNWFITTTIICTGVSLFGIFLSVLSAYALSRFDFPAKGGLIAIVLGTQMFPGIILLLPLLIMWNTLELTGSIFGLTLAYASFAVPFSTFMLKGFFDSLSTDLEEAAMVDGCTQLGAFTRVILPLSLPGLASTFLFSFLTGYTEYLLALTLYRGDAEHYTIALALINVFRVDYQNYYFPDLALYSLLVAAPILLIFVYLQRFLIAGLAAGGTKG